MARLGAGERAAIDPRASADARGAYPFPRDRADPRQPPHGRARRASCAAWGCSRSRSRTRPSPRRGSPVALASGSSPASAACARTGMTCSRPSRSSATTATAMWERGAQARAPVLDAASPLEQRACARIGGARPARRRRDVRRRQRRRAGDRRCDPRARTTVRSMPRSSSRRTRCSSRRRSVELGDAAGRRRGSSRARPRRRSCWCASAPVRR